MVLKGLQFDQDRGEWLIKGISARSTNPDIRIKYQQESDLLARITLDSRAIIRDLVDRYGWEGAAKKIGVSASYLRSGRGLYRREGVRPGLQEKALQAYRRARGARRGANLRKLLEPPKPYQETRDTPKLAGVRRHFREEVGELSPEGFRRAAQHWIDSLGSTAEVIFTLRVPPDIPTFFEALTDEGEGEYFEPFSTDIPGDEIGSIFNALYKRPYTHKDGSESWSTDPAELSIDEIADNLDRLANWIAGLPDTSGVRIQFYARELG